MDFLFRKHKEFVLRQKNMIFAVYRKKHLTSVRIFCVCCHSKHSSSYFWPETLLLKPLLFGGIWWPCGGENLKFCQDKNSTTPKKWNAKINCNWRFEKQQKVPNSELLVVFQKWRHENLNLFDPERLFWVF